MVNIGIYPDAELVICSWIMSIPGIQVDYADWRLPWDLPVAFHYGYAQVTVINGVPDKEVPLFHTIAQVDFWVGAPSEDRIFRVMSSGLAKSVQYACYDRVRAQRQVIVKETLPNGDIITFPNAHVYTAVTMTEPHYIQSRDNPFYEGYSMDMEFTWTSGITTK
jgi:hypothetical protein